MSYPLRDMAHIALTQLRDPSFDLVSSAPRLASYFALADHMRGECPELEVQLHRRMVHETVQWAARSSPFYRRLHSRSLSRKGIISLDDFEAIPILERDEIARNIDEMRAESVNFAFATFTSGTTSGEPLIIERSEEEQQYLLDFLSALSPPQPAADRSYALRLATPWHGRVLEFPSPFHLIPVSVTTLSGLKTAAKLLMRKYVHNSQEKRISGLGGGLISVQRLTSYLELSVDKDLLPRLSALQSTSEYVTRRARRQIEGFWGLDLIDRFGVSEAIVGACRCRHCKRYHLEPYGYAEVISFKTGRPVVNGVGRLVLTGYYPFMQAVPFVRYASGDAVRLFAADCTTGRPGIELLGRIGRSALSDGSWLIGEYEIYDILDEHAALQRAPIYTYFPSMLQEAGAYPVFRHELQDGRHILHTALRRGARLQDDGVEDLGQDIRRALTDRTGCAWEVVIERQSECEPQT